jgi:Late exocytosis, associated with Golgi transport
MNSFEGWRVAARGSQRGHRQRDRWLQGGAPAACPPDAVSSFDKTSMANIAPNEDVRLWAHVVALYIITFFVLRVRLS